MSAIVQHPRAVELVARRQLRRKVEAAVDRLLAILDDLDGDPEAEPWLGAPEMADRCQAFEIMPAGGYRAVPLTWARGAGDGREEENEHGGNLDADEIDNADQEPSQGAPENPHDQRRWRRAAGETSSKATNMRSVLIVVGLLPVLAVLDIAFWLCDPERRLVRSAMLAGIAVGRVAAGAAW